MYKAFQKEMYGREVIESDSGFLSYSLCENNEVYIHTIFVKEEDRRTGKANDLFKKLVIDHSPNTIYSYVDLTTLTAESSIVAHINRGCKIHNSNENSIIFIYEVK